MITKSLKIGLLFIAICFCISCSESANESKPSHRLIGSWRCDLVGMNGQKTGSHNIETFKEDGKYELFGYSVQWSGDPVYGDGYTWYGTYTFDENSNLLNVSTIDINGEIDERGEIEIYFGSDSLGVYYSISKYESANTKFYKQK